MSTSTEAAKNPRSQSSARVGIAAILTFVAAGVVIAVVQDGPSSGGQTPLWFALWGGGILLTVIAGTAIYLTPSGKDEDASWRLLADAWNRGDVPENTNEEDNVKDRKHILLIIGMAVMLGTTAYFVTGTILRRDAAKQVTVLELPAKHV